MPEIVVSTAVPVDAGEILTVQRAAFLAEAWLYSDLSLPPLTESFDEVLAAVTAGSVVKATLAQRIVGAGRAWVEGTTLNIARLAVAPDLQGRGVGTSLLARLEADAPAAVHRFTLCTGSRSTGNIRLYERFGYRECRRERLNAAVELVHLDKQR